MNRKIYIFIFIIAALFVDNYAHAALVNIAPNNSFESDPCIAYFTYPATCSTEGFSWDSQIYHTGKYSVKIVSTKKPGMLSEWLNKNGKIPIIAGHKYNVSLWLKTENVDQHAELNVNYWGPDSQIYINKSGGSSAIIFGNSDWTQVSVQAEAPTVAAYLRFEARLYGSGTLWIDDVVVQDLTDTTAPILTNIISNNITANSANITWTTDELSTSQISYSIDGSFSNTIPQNPIRTLNHAMGIPYLIPNTTYNYRVVSADSTGNISTSLGRTFTTLSVPDNKSPNIIINLSASSVTQTSLVLSWTSPVDLPAGGQAALYDIRYSTSSITASNWVAANQVTGEPTPVIQGINQSYVLPGLLPGTTYYIGIKSEDSALVPNISAISNIVVQSTLPKSITAGLGGGYALDKITPTKPSNLRIFGGPDQILLSWSNPIDIDFVRNVIVRKEGSYPISVTDGVRVYEGKGLEFTDTKISKAKIYYYAVFAFDHNLNYSRPATGSSYLGKNTETEIVVLRTTAPAPLTVSDVTVQPTETPILISGINIARILAVGSYGEDVKILQQFLQQKGYFPQSRQVTTYFGSITLDALQKFQCAKLKICSGTPSTTGYGATGLITRDALKSG